MSGDVLQALDRLSVEANAKELKQSVRIACELRECIVHSQDCANTEICTEQGNHSRCEQMQIAQHLQNTLTALQVLVKDCSHDLTVISGNALQNVAKVAGELQHDLTLFVAIVKQAEIGNEIDQEQERVQKLGNEYIKQEDKVTISEELVSSENDMASKKQAIETIVPLMSVVLDEAVNVEVETHFREDKEENTALVIEQDTFIENISSAANEIAQSTDKTMAADERVAVSGVEAAKFQSEELVPPKTVDVQDNTINIIGDDELAEFGAAVGIETVHVQIAQCEGVDLAVASEVIHNEGVIPTQVTDAGMLHIYTNNTSLI